MGRKNEQARITTAVRAYLAVAEERPPEKYRLDVKHVATAAGVGRTSIYKYGLVEEIRAAARRQHERLGLQGGSGGQTRWQDLVRKLREELRQAETRNKTLVAQLNLVEANAARLGIDPEALYQPLVKPIRDIPLSGQVRLTRP
jgi:hypothetical protein